MLYRSRFAASLAPALVAAVASAPAFAADVSLGLGAVLAVDLDDPSDGPLRTELGVGAGLLVPVRVVLTPAASVRTNVRLDYHGGSDIISWEIADGERTAEPNQVWMLAAGVTVGPEVSLPVASGPAPYLAGGIGAVVAGTFHSFTRCALMDPAKNDCSNPDNVDPYAVRPALLTDVALGVQGGEGLQWWLEAAYSAAFLSQAPLAKSAPGFDVQREAFGWNAVRGAAGLSFSL